MQHRKVRSWTTVDPTAEKKMSGNVTVGVRPENWRLVNSEDGGLPVTVTVVEELGADSFVYGTCDVEGTPSNVIVRIAGRHHPQKGETLYDTIKTLEAMHPDVIVMRHASSGAPHFVSTHDFRPLPIVFQYRKGSLLPDGYKRCPMDPLYSESSSWF